MEQLAHAYVESLSKKNQRKQITLLRIHILKL